MLGQIIEYRKDNKMNICIYGAASDKIAEIYKQKAEKLGAEIARRGHTLIYGAGSTGLMGACAKGAISADGKVIGVAPHFMHDIEDIYSACTTIIHTETMAERKGVMEGNADAFVIVPGGIGTYDELFQALTLKQLKRHNKPIVLYNIDNFYDNIVTTIDDGIKKGFISSAVRDMFVVRYNCRAVVDYIEAANNGTLVSNIEWSSVADCNSGRISDGLILPNGIEIGIEYPNADCPNEGVVYINKNGFRIFCQTIRAENRGGVRQNSLRILYKLLHIQNAWRRANNDVENDCINEEKDECIVYRAMCALGYTLPEEGTSV